MQVQWLPDETKWTTRECGLDPFVSGKSVRPAYRERMDAALATLDYRPNMPARRLRSQSASVIGLIVSDIANPFFVRFVQAI